MPTTPILTRMSNPFDKQKHVIKNPYERWQVCLKLLLSGNLPSTQKMPSAAQKEGDEFHISFVKVKRFKPAQQEIFCQLANGEKRQF